MKLNLNGYHLLKVDFQSRKAVLQLEDLQVRITLDFSQRSCVVESRQSVGQLKAISDLIKQTLLLI
jgi:hypothetical protein